MCEPNVERTVSDATAGSQGAGNGSHPNAWPRPSSVTGALPNNATSTRERTVDALRHSALTTKKNIAVEHSVSTPIPRPKLPRTLRSGATESTVVITHQVTQAAMTDPRTRARRSHGS